MKKKVHLFNFVMLLFTQANCKSDIQIGYRLTLAIPIEYNPGFIGRAFLMDTDQMVPNFRVALSVLPISGEYSCSLEVFLGEVKVWSSGHYSRFYTSDICVLELTDDGDLQLKGPKERIGWKTGTSGQGVERLQILKTGNLVLLDALNLIKWQSFNFPTDVMLWGQRLNVATRLTSFPSNSSTNNATSFFYTFEIQQNKIGLYLVSGKSNYSYWEFKPSKNRNVTFIELGSKGLEFFNDRHKKIAQISPSELAQQPLRFLALGNKTGNLGLYFYSASKGSFQAAFQALNNTCDLPLACKQYGICTFSNSCSCIGFVTKEDPLRSSDCGGEFSGGFCNGIQVEMLELNGVSSVLRTGHAKVNVSKEECSKFCLEDCKCASAFYSSGECFMYGVVVGVKQVDGGSGATYMIKVPKGTHVTHGKTDVKRWVLILVGVVDGCVLFLVFGGLGYCLIRRRRKNLAPDTNNNNT